MAPTVELTEEHFDFLLNPEDARGKQWVRSTMRAIADTMVVEWNPRLKVNVGHINKEPGGWYSCWVTLSRNLPASREAHLTIEIWPYQVEVFANIETTTVRKLFAKIDSAPGRFKEILGGLEDFYITVGDRKPLGPPRKFKYVRVMSFKTGHYIADQASFDHLAHLLRSLWYPGTYPQFSVRKSFNRYEVVEMKHKLCEHLIGAAKELQPLLEFLNE